MSQNVSFKINGEVVEVDIEPNVLLLDVLREKLTLTGAKRACEHGNCGACTVLMGGLPVNACTVLAMDARDKEIETIEGLGTSEHLHPLQKSFINQGAVQCGFCTPGMLMSAEALLRGNREPNHEEIKVGISGNLCRCTGYAKIIAAIESVSKDEKQII